VTIGKRGFSTPLFDHFAQAQENNEGRFVVFRTADPPHCWQTCVAFSKAGSRPLGDRVEMQAGKRL